MRRISEARQHLIVTQHYWIAISCLFFHILYSFSVICTRNWPDKNCTKGDTFPPLYFLIFPTWCFCHALMMRYYECNMEPSKLFYNCSLGLVFSILSTALAIWILMLSFNCSDPSFQVAYLFALFTSFGWSLLWANIFYQKFIAEDGFSYLLALRCACVPASVRKFSFIGPLLLFAFLYSTEIHKHWDDNCYAPLNFFCLTSIIVFILLAFFLLIILTYGRKLSILNSLAEESDDFPIYSYITSLLWYCIAALDIFCVVWAVMGIFWVANAGKCSNEVMRISIECILSLFFFGLFCPALIFLLKIEFCFPTKTSDSIIYYSTTSCHSHGRSSRMDASKSSIFSMSLSERDRGGGSGVSVHHMTTSTNGNSSSVCMEMGSELDLRKGFETQIAKKKRRKMYKTGKYLWSKSATDNSGSNIVDSSVGASSITDTESLLQTPIEIDLFHSALLSARSQAMSKILYNSDSILEGVERRNNTSTSASSSTATSSASNTYPSAAHGGRSPPSYSQSSNRIKPYETSRIEPALL